MTEPAIEQNRRVIKIHVKSRNHRIAMGYDDEIRETSIQQPMIQSFQCNNNYNGNIFQQTQFLNNNNNNNNYQNMDCFDENEIVAMPMYYTPR